MNILSFIPARGGSKGVPRKNLATLHGHPLIAYTICSSLQCSLITRTVVSSEDEEILEVAETYGAKTIRRPADLAADTSPTEPAIIHAVTELERDGFIPDYIILCQPTAPFRLASDLERAIALIGAGFDAVMSVSPIPAHYHPQWIKEMDDAGHLFSFWQDDTVPHPIIETAKYWQRQQLTGRYYWKNGAIYVMSRRSIVELGHRYGEKCAGLTIPNERAVNIDSPLDLMWADFLLKSRTINLDFELKKRTYD